jgi:hypothetical protein
MRHVLALARAAAFAVFPLGSAIAWDCKELAFDRNNAEQLNAGAGDSAMAFR